MHVACQNKYLRVDVDFIVDAITAIKVWTKKYIN